MIASTALISTLARAAIAAPNTFVRFMSIAAANKNKQVTTKDVPLDARLKHIKSVLYELPAKAAAEREAIAEQKDIDIPNGNLNIPTFLPAVYVGNDAVQIQKETIERAWCLLKQQESVMTMNALKRKYSAMRAAMEELEKTDSRLFNGTLEKAEVQLFPKRMRVPTDTPPLNGWNSDRTIN